MKPSVPVYVGGEYLGDVYLQDIQSKKIGETVIVKGVRVTITVLVREHGTVKRIDGICKW